MSVRSKGRTADISPGASSSPSFGTAQSPKVTKYTRYMSLLERDLTHPIYRPNKESVAQFAGVKKGVEWKTYFYGYADIFQDRKSVV